MKKIIGILFLLVITVGFAQPFSIRDRYNIITSATNIFLGQYAGAAVTTGTKNILLGSYAGYVLTTGYSNVYIGDNAGKSGSSGAAIGNVCIGTSAGEYMRTGQTNVFVGYNSGTYNTTGTTNTFIGNEAGYGSNVSGLSGQCNVGSGGRVGKVLTTGSYNVFNGYDCGYSATTAIGNTFVGTSSGSTTTTGKYNIAIGYDQDIVATTDSAVYVGVTNGDPLIYGNMTVGVANRGLTIDGLLTMTVPDWKIHRNDSIALTSADVWQTIQFDTMIVAESTLGFHFNADSSKVVFEYPGIFAILGCVHTKWRGGNTQESIFIRGRINSVEKRCLQRSHTHEKQTNDANDFNIVGTVAVDVGDSLDIQIQVTDTDYKLMGNYDIFDFPVALSLNISYITEKP